MDEGKQSQSSSIRDAGYYWVLVEDVEGTPFAVVGWWTLQEWYLMGPKGDDTNGESEVRVVRDDSPRLLYVSETRLNPRGFIPEKLLRKHLIKKHAG